MLTDLSLTSYILLFITAVSAGTLDTVAGGGGLLTIPAMLQTGLPPLTALGTNRLQGAIGEITASWIFRQHLQWSWKMLWPGLCCTLLGSACGTITAEYLGGQTMQRIIPWLMILMLAYSIRIQPGAQGKSHLSWQQYTCYFGLIIGFYNGFFGPGTGSIWLLGFILLVGYNLSTATMSTKPFNCFGNLISAGIFFYAGHIMLSLALLMGVGQIIGAHLGSHLVIHHGQRIIKPLFILVISLMIGKLFLDNYV